MIEFLLALFLAVPAGIFVGRTNHRTWLWLIAFLFDGRVSVETASRISLWVTRWLCILCAAAIALTITFTDMLPLDDWKSLGSLFVFPVFVMALLGATHRAAASSSSEPNE